MNTDERRWGPSLANPKRGSRSDYVLGARDFEPDKPEKTFALSPLKGEARL